MVEISGTEWRLAHVVILNACVLAAAWRFSTGSLDNYSLPRLPRILLGWFLIQYLSIIVPGLFGILNRWSITATALAISAMLWWLSRPRSVPAALLASRGESTRARLLLAGAAAFCFGYIAAVLFS